MHQQADRKTGKTIQNSAQSVLPFFRSTRNSLWGIVALRAALPAMLTVGLCACVMLWVALPVYRNSLMDAKKKEIRELTVVVWQLLNDYEKRVLDGELTLDEAKYRAKERIRIMRYGSDKKDYFWINSAHRPTIMIMHPFQTHFENTDVTKVLDSKGFPLFDEFQRVANENGQGFVSYHWQWKDDPNKIVPKISHVRLFAPWDWIVGTGAYVNDVQEEISAIMRKMGYIFAAILALILLMSFGVTYQTAFMEKRRRQIADKLQESEAKFRCLVESSSDWIWEVNAEGVYTYSSPQIEAILGYKPEEVVGKTPFDLIVLREARQAAITFKSLMKSGEAIVAFENINLHKDGREVVLETSAVPVFDEAGKVIGCRGMDRDITDRKMAQDELKLAHEQLQNVLDATLQVTIVATDMDGLISVFNTGAERMLGYTADEVIGKEKPSIFHLESEIEACAKKMSQVYKRPVKGFEVFTLDTIEGGYEEREWTLVRKDGTHLQVNIGVTAIRDEAGNITGFLGVAMDITKRKQAEEALEKRLVALTQPIDTAEDIAFEDLFNLEDVQRLQDEFATAAGVASIITHTDGTPITQPSNFCCLCKDIIRKTEKGLANCYKSDAALGRLSLDGPIIQECMSGGLWDAGTSITVGGKHIANWLIGQVRDETQTEEKMRQYAREIGVDEDDAVTAFLEVPSMTREKFEHVAQALFTIARQLSATAYQNVQQARFITDRKRIEEKLRSNEENLSITLNSIGDAVIATDIEGRVTQMNPVAEKLTGWTLEEIQGKPLCKFFRIVNADTRDTVESPVDKVLATGDIVGLANHTILVSKSGKEYQIADSGAPIQSVDGKTTGVVLVFRDVTEEYSLQEQLQQSQKMEAVGQLAGGVAHDFNNLLAGILGYAQLLEMKFSEESKEFEFANQIDKAATQAADLTRQLLAFSRKGNLQNTRIDLHEIIDEVVELLFRSIDKSIEIQQVLEAATPIIMGDPTQLQNAILNLGVNARDAMPEGGVMTFVTKNVILDAEYCHQHLEEILPGEYLKISVTDTGLGMSSDTQQRIFEPFFTTKPKGEGTGLGLASVYGCVKSHHGMIRVYSELEIGTAMTLFLPVAGFEDEKTSAHSELAAPIRGHGHVLVVDDEKVISDFVSQALESLGYTVSACSDGAEAIEMYRRHSEEIDLVILDLIMPRLGGYETFKQLKEIKPDVRVLVASGFTQNRILTGMLKKGALAFLNKPFRIDELSKLVSQYIKP